MSKLIKSLALMALGLSFLLLCACSQSSNDESSKQSKSKVFTNRPAKISAADETRLFTEPNTASVEVKTLKQGTIVWVLDETKKSTGHWYRLKTRSGADGWTQGSVEFCSVQEAQLAISRDREAFEDRLREMILDAAVNEVQAKNLHPLSNLISKTITTPLVRDSEDSDTYSVNVAALMVGKILQRTKHRLDLKVDLVVDFDKDMLDKSTARIKNVAITGDQTTDQMPVVEQLSLLKFILPLI